jgi:hypothetical protein
MARIIPERRRTKHKKLPLSVTRTMRKMTRQRLILIRNRTGKVLLAALGHENVDAELITGDVVDRCAIIDSRGYGGNESREGEDEKGKVHFCSRGLCYW